MAEGRQRLWEVLQTAATTFLPSPSREVAFGLCKLLFPSSAPSPSSSSSSSSTLCSDLALQPQELLLAAMQGQSKGGSGARVSQHGGGLLRVDVARIERSPLLWEADHSSKGKHGSEGGAFVVMPSLTAPILPNSGALISSFVALLAGLLSCSLPPCSLPYSSFAVLAYTLTAIWHSAIPLLTLRRIGYPLEQRQKLVNPCLALKIRRNYVAVLLISIYISLYLPP